jgi:hypothetical protein
MRAGPQTKLGALKTGLLSASLMRSRPSTRIANDQPSALRRRRSIEAALHQVAQQRGAIGGEQPRHLVCGRSASSEAALGRGRCLKTFLPAGAWPIACSIDDAGRYSNWPFS